MKILNFSLTKKQISNILIIVLLLFLLAVALVVVRQRQEIRKKAVGSGEVDLLFNPGDGVRVANEQFSVDLALKIAPTGSPRSINVSGADVIINASDKLDINSVNCLAPFTGLALATFSGHTATFHCAIGVGVTPVALSLSAVKPFAVINFTVSSAAVTGDVLTLQFDSQSTKVTEVVTFTGTPTPGLAPNLATAGLNASFAVNNITPTITPTPTVTPSPTPTGPTLTPSPTPSPTAVVSETPTPTLIPTATRVPSVTLTPTPPSGQEGYTIDIGTKAVLSINIGSGNTPQIKFTAKLAGAEGHPDMYFKLRAKDDLAFVDNPNSGPTCESPGAGGVDLYVPMKADNSGIYTPVTGINISAPAGAVVAPVSSDGWVSLAGLSAGKYYTLNLKGQKTRGTEMLKHVLLAAGQSASQNYDWTDNGLQPGDLPDPNNSNKQDCTVNSVDISLINSRLGKTDPDSLNIADVSYDGVVNANDIAQVVGTLSTKPDDDN